MRNQKGFILILTLVLLVMLMLVSASFFSRHMDATDMSAMRRDHDLALSLVESGITRVMGKYYNDDSTLYAGIGCVNASMIGDMNCDGAHDNIESRPSSFNPPLPLDVTYEFFLSNAAGAGITETSPGILQKIADGEARQSGSAGQTNAVLASTAYLVVNDLFGGAVNSPLLFTSTASGLAKSSSTWNAESADSKVAVFIEVTRNATQSNWLDIWVCGVAQVGLSKAYGMRYMGSVSYTHLTLPTKRIV